MRIPQHSRSSYLVCMEHLLLVRLIRSLFPVVLAFVGTTAARAQPDSTHLTSVQLQDCLLLTGPSTWEALQLSPDQLRRIQFVQDACKEECDVKSAQKQPNPISNADGTTVMAEVKNILTMDQYRAWMAHCAEGRGGGQAPR